MRRSLCGILESAIIWMEGLIGVVMEGREIFRVGLGSGGLGPLPKLFSKPLYCIPKLLNSW